MRTKRLNRIRRHKRIRKKIVGTKVLPRLSVYCGLSNLHVQFIDDINEKTLLSVSTKDKDIKKTIGYGGNVQAAKSLGEIAAERAKNEGIEKIVFDRGGFQYHGRVKALAEACRKGGLKF